MQLAKGGDPAKTSAVVLVQDEETGAVLQSRQISWSTQAAPGGAEQVAPARRRG
jgi:hypothetical protein